jgi:hypothetical protein
MTKASQEAEQIERRARYELTRVKKGGWAPLLEMWLGRDTITPKAKSAPKGES